MYINPFLAGVLGTLFAEIVIVIIIVMSVAIRFNKRCPKK